LFTSLNVILVNKWDWFRWMNWHTWGEYVQILVRKHEAIRSRHKWRRVSVWSFKRWNVRVWTGFMAGCCEHSNETVMEVP
jgi:hypothetical protein